MNRWGPVKFCSENVPTVIVLSKRVPYIQSEPPTTAIDFTRDTDGRDGTRRQAKADEDVEMIMTSSAGPGTPTGLQLEFCAQVEYTEVQSPLVIGVMV